MSLMEAQERRGYMPLRGGHQVSGEISGKVDGGLR